ncbi:hypothetical protein KP509_36G047200 [Ceratopteris richardii]|uniref:Protein YIP n=1 Tax=Ceratopteris richardii TaxID=49495 RepID=A0A8T2QBM9_CERRI|nr:hypothetical protein KP509_36G047200 [Ceratopteris richardii]
MECLLYLCNLGCSFGSSASAVADTDATHLPSQEGNLQTFPPINVHSKLLGPHPPSHEAEGSRQGSVNEAQGVFPQFLRVATYRPYFNVDTEEVSQRICYSLLLNGGKFISTVNHNPDLYGPFWICTTLIFVASAFGNLATYLSKHASWQFDIGKVTWAAGLFYAYTFLVPLLSYFFLKYINAALGLIQLCSLYGYSLFVFIPASVISLVPVEILRWVVIAGAGLVSAAFLATNIKVHLESNNWSFVVVMGVIILEACFALVFKILFFP